MDYLTAVQRIDVAGPPSGSDEEEAAVERITGVLSDFKAPDFRAKIRQTYAEKLYFNDTLTTIRDLDELERYLVKSGKALKEGTVDFLDHVRSGDDHYLRWRMNLRFKKIDPRELKQSVGMSHIRFDNSGRVILHKDFWDAAGGFFEHLPILGWGITKVKKRL